MARKTSEPPIILDAARVVEYAPFDEAMRSGARGNAIADGVAVDARNVAGLVIVEGLARDELFLLHCNEEWETLAGAPVTGIESARQQAEAVYPGVARLWRPYRELTDAERAEVASTRGFLRELLAEDPDA